MATLQATDFLCNLFTKDNITSSYIESEAHDSFARVGRGDVFRGYTSKQFLSRMDHAGVDKVLIASVVTWSYTHQRPLELTPVSSVVNATRSAPGRLFGLYGVNPWRRMEGVAELEDAVVRHGFRGMHLHPHGFGFPPDHAYYFPYYAKCAELGVAVVISMGTTLDNMPIDNARPYLLDRIALYFPDLRIVCAHIGWPWTTEAIALAVKHQNVYIGTSAHAPKYWPEDLIRYLNSSRGRGKVMWGTDWPLLEHKDSLEQIHALQLKKETLQALLRDNARKVFGL
jgi:hypothetical protein